MYQVVNLQRGSRRVCSPESLIDVSAQRFLQEAPPSNVSFVIGHIWAGKFPEFFAPVSLVYMMKSRKQTLKGDWTDMMCHFQADQSDLVLLV